MERLPERIAKLACIGVLVFKFKGTAVLGDFAVLHRRTYAFGKKPHRNHYLSAALTALIFIKLHLGNTCVLVRIAVVASALYPYKPHFS